LVGLWELLELTLPCRSSVLEKKKLRLLVDLHPSLFIMSRRPRSSGWGGMPTLDPADEVLSL
jgi:hypothetical protein